MEDYYSDAAPASKPEAPEPREDAGDSQTAELPKAILGGQEVKPGDTVSMEVVQVTENSVIVRNAGAEGEAEAAEPPAAAPSAGGDEMASMMG